jgi:trk system potassium uptake protein TrkA
MFVFITGGGRTGAQLATQLVSQNYKVRLVEHRRELLTRLHHELPTEVIYEGIATDPEVLDQAGLREANVLVATTNDDASNLVICYLGHTLFGVTRNIARINNPRNAWLFDDKFFVDEAISQADVMAHLIQEEMSLGDMMTRKAAPQPLFTGRREGARWRQGDRGRHQDIGLPDECVIAAIIRHRHISLLRGTHARGGRRGTGHHRSGRCQAVVPASPSVYPEKGSKVAEINAQDYYFRGLVFGWKGSGK